MIRHIHLSIYVSTFVSLNKLLVIALQLMMMMKPIERSYATAASIRFLLVTSDI